MKTSFKLYLLSLLAVLSFGCNKDDEDIPLPAHILLYNFEQNAQGWQGGMADFPKDWDQEKLEFDFAHEFLPAEVNKNGMGMMLSGRNMSDDLFLFMKKKVTGLKPNYTYRATFQVEFASKYPEASFGIGGSPGASVYLKAGGAPVEPMAVEEGDDIQMNIDKGNQAQGGKHMVVLGSIGIPGQEEKYQLVRRNNLLKPVQITTDATGSLWLIVGTDSGFEGTTTLYYNSVEVTLWQ
ncbi:hypothetical protein GCM10027443_00520 [Pontibacter brevis]